MPIDPKRRNGLDPDLAMVLARDLDFRIREKHMFTDRGIVTLLLNGRGIIRVNEDYALFVTSTGGLVRVYYCRIIAKLSDHPSQCPKDGHYLSRDSDGNEIWSLDGQVYNYAAAAHGSEMFGTHQLHCEGDLGAKVFIEAWEATNRPFVSG